MEHNAILILFIVGFCIIFLNSIIYILGQAVRRNAEINASYRDASQESTADALDNANLMTSIARILITSGAFILVLASAVGAWRIEDKYFKVSMLIFSALITAFLLAPSVFSLTV